MHKRSCIWPSDIRYGVISKCSVLLKFQEKRVCFGYVNLQESVEGCGKLQDGMRICSPQLHRHPHIGCGFKFLLDLCYFIPSNQICAGLLEKKSVRLTIEPEYLSVDDALWVRGPRVRQSKIQQTQGTGSHLANKVVKFQQKKKSILFVGNSKRRMTTAACLYENDFDLRNNRTNNFLWNLTWKKKTCGATFRFRSVFGSNGRKFWKSAT